MQGKRSNVKGTTIRGVLSKNADIRLGDIVVEEGGRCGRVIVANKHELAIEGVTE